MFVSLDHLPALQVFLSDANHGAKREAIAQATLNGASQSELDTFLARPQTTDSFLAFTAAVDARRSELPLIVRNHIRHLLHNPILAVAPEGYHAPLEPLCAPPHSPPLPDELWYVLSRLGESESLSLRNGWTIESARRSREVTQAYAARAATEGVRSVWCDGARVVASMYAGMGHFNVMAAENDGAFFRFLDGGANGYDQETNFVQAATLTADSIADRRVPWMALVLAHDD